MLARLACGWSRQIIITFPRHEGINGTRCRDERSRNIRSRERLQQTCSSHSVVASCIFQMEKLINISTRTSPFTRLCKTQIIYYFAAANPQGRWSLETIIELLWELIRDWQHKLMHGHKNELLCHVHLALFSSIIHCLTIYQSSIIRCLLSNRCCLSRPRGTF